MEGDGAAKGLLLPCESGAAGWTHCLVQPGLAVTRTENVRISFKPASDISLFCAGMQILKTTG